MRPDYSRGEYDLEALEPRLLLSADPIASLLDPAAQPKDKWGESVSVALMQTTATEGVNAASVKPVDYLDVADEPLTAPAPTFATPAVENSIVTQTTSSRSSALTVDGVKSIDAEGLVLRSQTQLSAQSVVTAQQVTSLNASNGPPEMSALAAGPVTPGAYSNLLTFITDTLNDAASGTLPATITDTYTFTNELTLGSVFKIQNASVTFNITVSGTSAAPVWNGTISISAGTVSLTLGSIASAVVTDGVDANLDGLSATYTLSNATATTGGTFSLNLDQITLTAFSGSLSATGSNFTLAYSPTTGLSNSDLNFNPVTVSLGAGASTVVNASGSGLVQVTETGVAAAINLTLSQGPSFAGQSIALSGTFKLRLNTTGVPVTSISGIAVDLPSPGGATYLKVIVQDASLTLSGATLTATELTFEKAGTVVTVTGVGTTFSLKAGTKQIVKATSNSFVMQFTDSGFAASVVGAAVEGPALTGFTLTGVVDFLVNTTGAAVTLPGVASPIPGVASGVYVLATVRGATVGAKASLAVSQSFLEATSLTFEKNAAGVSFSGTGLSVELRAGAKRIVGVTGASAAFQFMEDGFYGAILNATVAGPDFFDGPSPLFAIMGVVSLRINSTTSNRSILVGGGNVELAAGTSSQPFVQVTVTAASLTVVGSTLSADTLTFQQSNGVVDVGGVNVSFELKAGSKRIVGVSNATFAMRFSSTGFVAGVRSAAIMGPDFGSTFQLTGTVDLDINTTGATVVLDNVGSVTGVAGSTYIRASVTGAALTIAGSSLTATTLTFEKAGSHVAVGGTGLQFALKAGTGADAKKVVGLTVASFGFVFTDAGFVGAVRGAVVSGPDFANFTLAGAVDLDVNTTGADYALSTFGTISGGANGLYIKASVTGAALGVGSNSLTAETLVFEKSGDDVAVSGTSLGFELKAGTGASAKRVVGVSVASFGFVFNDDGMVASIRGGQVSGPQFAGFTLSGNVSLDINTTGANYTFVGGALNNEVVTGVAGGIYLKVIVTGNPAVPGDKATLALPGASLAVSTLIFEQNGTGVSVSGTGMLFELKAGTKRIVKVNVTSFGFVFTDAGMVGSIRNGTVTGPDITGFVLTGTVSFDINTTGANHTFVGGALDGFTVTGTAGSTYLRVRVTGDPTIPGDKATLAIPGFTLAATSFEFEQNGTNITVTGTGLLFELNAGAKRMVKVEVAAFGFVFTDAGMVGSIRNGTVTGPDITGFVLSGTVSLDINTTGANHTFVGGPLDGVTVTGTAGSTYLRVKVTGNPAIPGDKATLAIPGATLAASSFEFEKNGTNITVTGAGLFFELKAGTKRIVKVEVAAFGFVFTNAGMVGSIRNGTVTGPDITGFVLSGTVSLDINTTGTNYTFVGGALDGVMIAGVAGGTYLKVKVTGNPAITGDKATLVIPGATFAVTSFEFEKNGSNITVTGAGLLFELKAGAKRIVKVEVAAFGFVFTDAGMVGSIRNGTVTGPDITGFTLSGSVSLDINTTGLNYTFAGGALDGVLVPGVANGTYLRVTVSGDPAVANSRATLAVLGSELSATNFYFESNGATVSVGGAGVTLRLVVAGKRIIGVSNATFGFVFVESGFYGAMRNAQIEGPDFGGIVLTGKVSFDVNTTGSAQSVVLGGAIGTVLLPGTGTYVRVELAATGVGSPATLAVGGVRLEVDSFIFEKSGDNIAVQVTNLTFKLGSTFTLTGSADLLFTPTEFRINNATLTANALSVGSFLTITTPQVQLENFAVTNLGAVTGSISIRAVSASIFPGKAYTASISDRDDAQAYPGNPGVFDDDIWGLDGTFDVSTGEFSLQIDQFTLVLGTLLTAKAYNVHIQYDPDGVYPQTLLSIGNATVEVPRFGVTGTVNQLEIREDGFKFDSLTVTRSTAFNLLGIVEFANLTFTITNFEVIYATGVAFTGTISLASSSIKVLPGKPFTATATGASGILDFSDGKDGALTLTVQTFTLQLGSALTATATGVTINTAPGVGEYVASFVSISATLTSIGISGTIGYTGTTAGYNTATFAFGADGTFHTFGNFGFKLAIGGAAGASGFSWPTWLPIQITSVSATWVNINTNPENFVLKISAGITGLHGIAGLSFGGAVEDLEIDIGKLLAGQFPIIGVGSVSATVSGAMFGGQVSASFFLEILKLQRANDSAPWTTYTGSPTSGYQTKSVIFGGLDGSMVFAALGVQVRIGLSELGPLSAFVRADVPILLEPISGLTLDGLRGGIQFFSSMTTPADALALRGKAYAPPGDKTIAQWKLELHTAVINQANAGGSFSASMFTEPMLITAGATLYTSYTSKLTFRAEVDLVIDTSGKILINAAAVFGDNLSVRCWFFGDLSKIKTGEAKFVFLVDMPEKVGIIDPIYSIGGTIEFKFVEFTQRTETFAAGSGSGPRTVTLAREVRTLSTLTVTVGGNAVALADYTTDQGAQTVTYTGTNTGSMVVSYESVDPLSNPTALADPNAADPTVGFQILITGVARLQTPVGGLFAQMSGEILMTFTPSEFRIRVAAQLEISTVGQLGAAGGEFVIRSGVNGTEVFGALQLQTGESLNTFLQPKGIYINAVARLVINTTAVDQPVSIRMPLPGAIPPYSNSELSSDSVIARASSFSLIISGSGELRDPIAQRRLMGIEAAFAMEVNALGLEILAVGKITVGPAAAPTMVFEANALLIVRAATGGIAGRMSLIRSNGEGVIRGVEFDAAFHLVLNTTGETITYTIPTFSPAIPTVNGPNPANLAGPPISYEVITGGVRQLVVPAGPPPAELTDPRTWVSSSGAGPYVVIFGGGKISLLDTFEMTGGFRLEISNTVANGFVLDLRLNMSLTIDPVGTANVVGMVRVTSAGLLASLDLQVTGGTTTKGGFSMTGRFWLEMNTTLAAASVDRLALNENGVVIPGVVTPTAIAAETVRVFIGATVDLGGMAQGSGEVLIVADLGSGDTLIYLNIKLNVKVGATTLLTFNAQGLLVLKSSGFAGRLNLTFASDGVAGVTFAGNFHLIVNTTGAALTIDVPDDMSGFQGPSLGNATGLPLISYEIAGGTTGQQIKIPKGAPPSNASNYIDWDASSGSYFVIVGGGSIGLLDNTITLEGGFRVIVSTTAIQVAFAMTAVLGPLGRVDVDGGFVLSSAGVVAAINVNLATGQFPGFSLTAKFTLEINTTAASSTVPRFNYSANGTVNANGPPGNPGITANTIRVFAAGQISIFSVVSGSGTFTLTIRPGIVDFHADVTFSILNGLFSATASIDALVYSSGLVLNVTISVDGTLTVIPGLSFKLEGSANLRINTTGVTKDLAGISIAAGMRLSVFAKIDLASVIKVSGTIIFTFQNNGAWRIEVPESGALTADFFGLATIRAWGFFQSDAQFDIHVRGDISLGAGGTGLFGSVTFDASYLKVLNPTSGFLEFKLALSASISGSAKLFGITIGGFNASFSYDSLTGKLSLRVTVDFLFFSKSMTFSLGYFKLEAPPPFNPAGDLIDGRFWLNGADPGADGIRGDGVLYLNLGSRAAYRSNVSTLTDSEDETFLIRHVAGSPDDLDGETIDIIGLGRKATYTGVKKIILLDTAGGENVLILGSDAVTSAGGVNYVESPFYGNGGSGADLIVYYGEGNRALGSFLLAAGQSSPTYTQVAVIRGNGGEDYIEIGVRVTGAVWLTGGAADDTLIGGSNADTLDGGEDNDRIVGRAGADLISGGTGIDIFYWAPGDGADNINGGGNSTDVNWASTDAVPLNVDTLVFIATNGDESITLMSTGNNSATLLYVRGQAESVSLTLILVEVVDAHLGQGRNTAVINDLLNSGITTLEFRVSAVVPSIDALLRREALPTASVVAPDLFRFTGSSRDDEYVALSTGNKIQITQKNGGATVAVATLHGISRPGTSDDDSLELKGGANSDKLDAQGITSNLIQVHLFGEAGTDRLIGTPFADDLQGGAGNDTYTSGAGVDLFTDADGSNTLIEVLDRDMSLFNNIFVSGTLSGFNRSGVTASSGSPLDINRPTGPTSILTSYSDAYAAGAEVENLAAGGTPIFNQAILVGGAGNNVITIGTSTGTLSVGGTNHTVTPWTGTATLDNRSNGNLAENGFYIVHLNGSAGATIVIADSAVTTAAILGIPHLDETGSNAYDELYVIGTAGADRITLRAGDGHVPGTDPRGLIYSGDPTNAATRTTITHRNLEHVSVRTLGGADQIDAERTVVATVLESGDNDDVITLGGVDAVSGYSGYERWAAVVIRGGNGLDAITIGTLASAPANTVNAISGHVLVLGDAGADTLVVNDSGDSTDNLGHLTSSRLTGLGMGTFGITYRTLEVLTVNLGSGGDTFSIGSTHAGSTTLNANSGSDLIVVGSTAAATPGVLDNIAGALFINGDAGGADTLVVLDNADTSANRGELTSSTLTGLDMAVGITYTGFEAAEIYLGTGADALFIDTTHLGTTRVDGGAGDDVFRIKTIQGATTITGAAGNDRFVVNVLNSGDDSPLPTSDSQVLLTQQPPRGTETGVNGIGATLNLDGQADSDRYWIYTADQVYSATHAISLINVLDSGAGGTNSLRVYGSDTSADTFLVRRNFLASISATSSAERINYAGLNGGIRIDTRGGDDIVAFDDTGTTFDVYLGLGNDRLQVGQMFDSPRVYDRNNLVDGLHPLIAGFLSTVGSTDDEITTAVTTKGWLSVGTSHELNAYGGDGADSMTVYHNSGELFLFGEEGDDTFIIRAFALYGSSVGNADRELTTLDGGQGSDYVEYAENAPVAVDGGGGFDTVIVIATEFSDRLVITADGVSGAGLDISFTGIERLTIYGAEGDDIFIVIGTAAGVEVTIWGGLGSDTFLIGGIENDPDFGTLAFDLSRIQGPLRIEGGDDPLADYVIPPPLLYLTDTNPFKFVRPVIVTLFDREEEMIDRAFFNDSGNTVATTGYLDQGRIWGLRMSAGSTINGNAYPAGVVYGGMEMMQVLLGTGGDRFQINRTHAGITEVFGGAGGDVINVVSVSGHTTLDGGLGDDTFNIGSKHIAALDLAGHGAAAPQGVLDTIGASLVVVGGGGSDTLNADDSGDLTSDVATLTGTMLSGLNLRDAIVWTVQLTVNFEGEFSLNLTVNGSTVQTGLMKTRDGAVKMRDLLRTALGLNGGTPVLAGIKDVIVDVAGDLFTIIFVTDESVTPDQISLAPSQSNLGVVAARSSLNLLQTINVNAGAGSFSLYITDAAGALKQSLTFAWNVSAADLRAALFAAFKTILGEGNVFLRDFLVSKQGSTFFVAYQGQLKGTLGGQLTLRSASPTHTVTPFGANSADFVINSAAGTYRLLLGDGRISAPIAFNANAAAITAAIGHALGSTPFTVAVQGGGFRITFTGAGAIGLDARNLVAVIDVGARTNGISYFGITTLNLDFGSASDVVNVQGTSSGTVTNIWANGGDDKVFISSLAQETLASAALTRFLEGNLDRILGTLNLSLGNGRHKLMISDEAALAGDGSAATRARVTDQSQFTNPTVSEIWITGLAPAGISYGASAAGNIADGVTLWTGWGADYLDIDGAHQRAGVRTTTSVNTGLGNDNVLVGLNTFDGHFILNAQGPYDGYLAFADADIVDGSSSTRSLILFGGQGADTLKGGSADDFIFGDRARVDYVNAGGLVARFGSGGPDDSTDGVDRPVTLAYAVDRTVGAADIVYGGAGDDIVLGGVGNDRLDGGIGHDLLFGDNATLDRTLTAGNMATADPRYRTLVGGVLYDLLTGAPKQGSNAFANPAGSPSWSDFDVTLVDHSTDIQTNRSDLFGHDYIAGGAGRDLIFGGLGNDTVQGDGSIDYVSALYRIDPVTGAWVLPTGAIPAGVPAGTDVGAWRGADGLLYIGASFEAATDGDDYIEGNGGNDTIFGGLGQDDIVGGSSSLAGLSDLNPTVARGLRPDGSDLIFGGAGTRTGRNDAGQTGTDSRARDSDTILGDNGNIYRAVGANGQLLSFGYDNYNVGGLKIIPRVTELLDYTNGGVDGNPVAAAFDIGAADEIHGEGGDDSIHGMLGGDVLYGDGQDDDLIGGTGADWISGGAGLDGILGDDGRLWTSRNGTAEPLYGIAAIPTGGLNLFISTAGKVQQATINVSGALKKTGLLELFNLGADDYVTSGRQASNDILFGGLGGDWIHGGAGDDAISGAEALPEYFSRPINGGNYLAWGLARAGEFSAYDEYNPMKKVYVVRNVQGLYVFADRTDEGAIPFILNFVDGEDDADDALFGDLGNDWIVGGRGRDHLYGGWGDDLLNADDLHDTNSGLNNAPDTSTTYEDIAFGGAGRDILMANTGGDRLIDWAGEFNSYLVPFAPFGLGTVSRALQPQIAEFLYNLSRSDGADTTRAVKSGGAAARNGEPFGELGLVLQQDFAWFGQTGSPNDPQPGNIPGGARDVLRSATFDRSVTDGFFIDSGTWDSKSGRVEVAPTTLGGDAVAIFHVGDALPLYYELRVTMNALKPIAGYKANAYLIFDYQSPTDFKFVGLNSSTNKMEMGHRTAAGWIVDVQTPMLVKAGVDFNLTLAVNGTTATLIINNKNVFSYAYAARVVEGVSYGLNGGLVGIGADNAKVSFDNFSVQVLPPEFTLSQSEDFNDGTDDLLRSVSIGAWSVVGGQLVLTPSTGNGSALRTADLNVGTNSVYQLQARLTTAGFAGIVFDYYGPNDYKFAGINVATKQVVIGHVGKRGIVIDATLTRTSLNAISTFQLDVSLKGTTVSVSLDGSQVLGFVYNAPVMDGEAGVFAREGNASFDTYLHRTNDLQFLAPKTGSFLSAAYAPLTAVSAPASATAELQAVIDAVISWFSAQGSTAAEIAILRATPVGISHLAGLLLGWTDGTRVEVDGDAAGHGWSTGIWSKAGAGVVADGRMDLMSVIAHEFAHILGRDHVTVVGSPVVFMNDLLLPGTRLLPNLVAYAAASDGSVEVDRAAGLRYAADHAFTGTVMAALPHSSLSSSWSAGTEPVSMAELFVKVSVTKFSALRSFGKRL